MKEKTADNIEPRGEWYRTAVQSAWVSGVFVIVAAAFVFVNYLQINVLGPVREERLDMLKLRASEQPKDEQLVSQIRRLDLEIRRGRIRQQNFAERGGFLLVGGFIVLVASLKIAAALSKKPPHPQGHREGRAEQLRSSVLARRAVAGGLAVLGVAAFVFALWPTVELRSAGETAVSYPSAEQIAKNWPGFRGPQGLGISAYTNISVKFNVKTGESILFKSKIPLGGFNSPIVWGGRVFVSGADEERRLVFCFDAGSGKLLWTGDVPSQAVKKAETTEDTGYAAPTMVTDGKRVYAIFATGDIGCFDYNGKRLWSRNLGVPESAYGYSSSLAMYRNLVLIQYDQAQAEDGKSRMIALDGFSGRTVWEVKRPVANSWTSPVVINTKNGFRLITGSDPWVIEYEPDNGAEIWRANCLGTDAACSPVFADGMVFAVKVYDSLIAIRDDGKGDVTKTNIAWVAEDGIPDICSPVTNGQVVLVLTTDGLLTCYAVKDGQKVWEEELEEDFYASPSFVGDKLYLLSGKGRLIVAGVENGYRELARSELGEKCYASPAFVDGRIYIRGVKNLYCIGNNNGK